MTMPCQNIKDVSIFIKVYNKIFGSDDEKKEVEYTEEKEVLNTS